ncbi:ankyrin repeat domain-containing protein [Lihuaxuella thermophila]|uniref:Ankyrin repeat-containing protein n=1 Tax=Lihuaxuella thermophila TaxID=1173111 RepID=A0A1H8CWL7_9BACL|nr:ankyrin repeat domain-containing protein [Lihuaxuella thermophila]SEM99390.1 Ankyrin repeat-containing protein [Lihuaxuella thermophila]
MSRDQLLEAIRTGVLAEVKQMVQEHPQCVETGKEEKTTRVITAAYKWKKEILDELLSQRPNLTFFEAVIAGEVEKVAVFLQQHPERMNEMSRDGWTPLHLASFFGHVELVRFLLKKGADVRAISRNQMANQPLHAAIAGGVEEVALLLLKHGARVNTPQHLGYTPLHVAVLTGSTVLVKRLLEWGADPSVHTDEGKTALDLAMENGKQEVLDLLRVR